MFSAFRKILKRTSKLEMFVFLGERCCVNFKENHRTDGPLHFLDESIVSIRILKFVASNAPFETDNSLYACTF